MGLQHLGGRLVDHALPTNKNQCREVRAADLTRHSSRCLPPASPHRAAGLDFLQPPPTALDLGEDILRSRMPYEGFGIAIPGRDELLDRGDQIRNAGKAAAPDGFPGQVPEPAFHQIQPTGTGGNKVDLEARMPLQPALYL